MDSFCHAENFSNQKNAKNQEYTTLISPDYWSITLSNTIDKLRHNKSLTTTTLNDLCRILGCRLEDIACYIPSEDDQTL